MGDCFGRGAKILVSGVKDVAVRIRRAVRQDSGPTATQAGEPLKDESGKTPKSLVGNNGMQVTNTDVDDSLEPMSKVVKARWPKSSQLTEYGKLLTQDIIGGSNGHVGLRQIEDVLNQSDPDVAAIKPHLAACAKRHVQLAIEDVPKDFGLHSDTIRNWLLQPHQPDTVATDLKQFLIDQLGRLGHGPAVADWLYQQILAAGSTCMTSLELQLKGRSIERCKAYMNSTIMEIEGHAAQCSTKESASILLAQWKRANNAAGANWQRDNERIQALQQQLQPDEPEDTGIRKPIRPPKKTSRSEDGSESGSAKALSKRANNGKRIELTSTPDSNPGSPLDDDEVLQPKADVSLSRAVSATLQPIVTSPKPDDNVAQQFSAEWSKGTAKAFEKLQSSFESMANGDLSSGGKHDQ